MTVYFVLSQSRKRMSLRAHLESAKLRILRLYKGSMIRPMLTSDNDVLENIFRAQKGIR